MGIFHFTRISDNNCRLQSNLLRTSKSQHSTGPFLIMGHPIAHVRAPSEVDEKGVKDEMSSSEWCLARWKWARKARNWTERPLLKVLQSEYIPHCLFPITIEREIGTFMPPLCNKITMKTHIPPLESEWSDPKFAFETVKCKIINPVTERTS